MNCRDWQRLLQQHLDGHSDPPGDEAPSDFAQHRASCPRCAACFAAGRTLLHALTQFTPPVAPLDLTDRIVQGILNSTESPVSPRRPRSAPATRWRKRSLVRMAVAASLLVAAGWLGWILRPPPSLPQPESAPMTANAVNPETPDNSLPSPRMPPLRATVAEAGSAMASLTSRTADATVGSTTSFLPLVTPQPLESLPMPSVLEEATTRPLAEAGAEVSAGLEPVTRSARRALDMFIRMPVGMSDPPPPS